MSDAHAHRWLRWPAGLTPGTMAYGADYNPDQWPREVWEEDVRLMREAGVNIVAVAIFSWAHIQPEHDRWEFGWLDDVLDLLHAGGIAVNLATATASPPPWLTSRHPEILPVTENGETLWPGGRQHWRPTSPVFRTHALRLVTEMAERYRDHPALAAWHVSNELGCHNLYDYSDDAANAFRNWLRERYGDLDALNNAWGTAFWSQRYSAWDQILPPRRAAAFANPTQQLDFRRFSSDALREHLRAERDILHRVTPDVPVTTNFMVMEGNEGMDYASWAPEVDFVSNDHYRLTGETGLDELSFSANLTGNLAGGRPWYLMEHSTSAVNWRQVNPAKEPGELMRDSLTHVAHGADAVCFFQWRQSAAGAERYHSAMVPHAGSDSAVFDAVVDLGSRLSSLAAITGSHRRPAPVAVVVDWESWWAAELDSQPSSLVEYRREALDWYRALLRLGVRADVVPSGADLSGYRMVVAPILHIVGDERREKLTRFVEGGGHLVTTYFSGIVDEDVHVWLGGYPGALRELLGIRIEEFAPLPSGETVALDNGTTGSIWTDRIDVTDPDVAVLASYASGGRAGRPAVTRRTWSGGSAAYVSTRLGPEGLSRLLPELLAAADVESELPPATRGKVELAVRTDGDDDYWFLINRTDAEVTCAGLDGVRVGDEESGDAGTVVLGAHEVVVLRRAVAS